MTATFFSSLWTVLSSVLLFSPRDLHDATGNTCLKDTFILSLRCLQTPVHSPVGKLCSGQFKAQDCNLGCIQPQLCMWSCWRVEETNYYAVSSGNLLWESCVKSCYVVKIHCVIDICYSWIVLLTYTCSYSCYMGIEMPLPLLSLLGNKLCLPRLQYHCYWQCVSVSVFGVDVFVQIYGQRSSLSLSLNDGQVVRGLVLRLRGLEWMEKSLACSFRVSSRLRQGTLWQMLLLKGQIDWLLNKPICLMKVSWRSSFSLRQIWRWELSILMSVWPQTDRPRPFLWDNKHPAKIKSAWCPIKFVAIFLFVTTQTLE